MLSSRIATEGAYFMRDSFYQVFNNDKSLNCYKNVRLYIQKVWEKSANQKSIEGVVTFTVYPNLLDDAFMSRDQREQILATHESASYLRYFEDINTLVPTMVVEKTVEMAFTTETLTNSSDHGTYEQLMRVNVRPDARTLVEVNNINTTAREIVSAYRSLTQPEREIIIGQVDRPDEYQKLVESNKKLD